MSFGHARRRGRKTTFTSNALSLTKHHQPRCQCTIHRAGEYGCILLRQRRTAINCIMWTMKSTSFVSARQTVCP